jgi:hypothetical protein
MFHMIFQNLIDLGNQGVMFLVVPPKDGFAQEQLILPLWPLFKFGNSKVMANIILKEIL